MNNQRKMIIIGVTLLVVLSVGCLFIGKSMSTNKCAIDKNTSNNSEILNPVSIPYAKVAIKANTVLTDDMIGIIKVPKSVVDDMPMLITTSSQVIGKYVRYDTIIPEGSMFYSTQLMLREELPNSIFVDIPNGYTIYSLKVDMNSTYGNSIMPDDYIDLYFQATDDNQKVIFAKFIESIKVLAVKDAQGNHVFSSLSSGVPTEMLFALPDEYFQLLRKADLIKTNAIKITPVPRNSSYSSNPGVTQVVSDDIVSFINSKAN